MSLRILVIDDDPDMRRLLSDHVLNHPGWEVVTLPDAYQALVELRYTTFDVVVVDHLMPGATGVDFLHRLERSLVDVPVIVLSALVPGRIGDEALAAGAVAVVPKDRVEVDLVPAIERTIALRR
jgi:CheY-like chemotaxis protein